MTDQPATPAPPHPGLIQRAENLLHHAGTDAAPLAAVIEPGLQAFLRSHSANLIRSAAELLESHPGTEHVVSDLFTAALGVAQMAGITL